MLAKRSKPGGGGKSSAMPLGMSAAPLSEAELAQLDKRVQGWRKFKVGREVVKKVGKDTVEGIIFGVERDELRGPPAVLTSTYVVLWDAEGKHRRGKQPLANLIPGDKGVEQEIVSGEVLDSGTTVAMRAAFSHPELMLPIKELQEHRWSWKTMPPQKQRLLLEWTPMNEHAERQKRHKDMGDKVIKEMKKEREKGETAAGGGPRRDWPGGGGGPRRDGAGRKARPAAGSSKGSRKRPPPAEESSDEDSSDEGEEEEEDEAMQDAVSGSEDRFTDADEGALPGAEGEWEDFSPQGQPPPRITPSQQPKQQQPTRKPAAAGGRAASKGNAAAAKAGGKRPSKGSGGAIGSRGKKQSGGGAAAGVPGALFSSDDEVGHPALEDMVQLPPGSEPTSVPVSLTLTAGDKLLQEYKDQRFAADEEFEPEHIVAQRPPGQPREYLCKWRNYELDPTDWSSYEDLAETTALDAWEKEHPPPQGAGKPPPPLQPEPAPKKGSAKRKRKL